MSIIAVKGVPANWLLKHLVMILEKCVKGQFKGLKFAPTKGSFKTAYIKLSAKIDALEVISSINRLTLKNCKLIAFIPEHVPDILMTTHREILVELQSKYTGLYNLSKKTDHRLMDDIAQTIFKRLKKILETNKEAAENCSKLSKSYRKVHPHFADFQLILSMLHALEDMTGTVRTVVTEQSLGLNGPQPQLIENTPYTVKKSCHEYAKKVIKKVREHIESLQCDMEPDKDSEADVARKRVRQELKKISPYLDIIIGQVVSSKFVPQNISFHKMRIYGEPFLPLKKALQCHLTRHKAINIARSDRIFNMVMFNIPTQQLASLMTMDGTVIGGAKLVIRSSDLPQYVVQPSLIAEMKALCGSGSKVIAEEVDAEMKDWEC